MSRSTDSNPFTEHEIVSRVVTPELGSWLLKRRHAEGGHTSVFWARVTAAEGRLSVVGDFDPVVFAHGPREPIACVQWIGERDWVDGYRAEKASIGTGHDRVYEYSTDAAIEDLRELQGRARKNAEIDADEEYTAAFLAALQAGIDAPTDYSGLPGVVEIYQAVVDALDESGYSGDHEELYALGKRLRQCTTLAVQAAHRLATLLQAEEPNA